MTSENVTIRCCACGKVKAFSDFNRWARGPHGRSKVCRVCDNERSRKRRLEKPEETRQIKAAAYQKRREYYNAKSRDYAVAHPAGRKGIVARYYVKNQDKVQVANLKWRAMNPDKVRAISRKRQTAKAKASPPWLTESHWAEIDFFYTHAVDCERVSGEKYDVDHIVPLQGRNICGLHVPWNLQVLPRDLNRRKHNRHE
jgi:hypothetical protein